MLRVVLALALLSGAAAQNCKSTQFQACTFNLATSIGLVDPENVNTTVLSNVFKDYTLLYKQLAYRYSANPGNVGNVVATCNSLEQFMGCMSSNYFCFSVQNFLQNNVDPSQAYAIDGTLRMYNFNCGAGLNTLVHEGLECAQRVLSGYASTLAACTSSYINNMIHDPNNGCAYQQVLTQCYAAPFQQSPCRRARSADVWWACEQQKLFSIQQNIACPISCDIHHGPPHMSEYLAANHKIDADGVSWFKIPDYYALVDGEVEKVEGEWMNN